MVNPNSISSNSSSPPALFPPGSQARREFIRIILLFTASIFLWILCLGASIVLGTFLHPLGFLSLLILLPMYFFVRYLFSYQLRRILIALEVVPK
ncbi:hypothetical protein [Candidatus Chlamydia sanziniae]|uniref:Uncharacterized protein n=1 Tax=Candidatus Chlamydia sanziniae TaxID=1806891 RepID=A0A1A9HTJ3_9CHLA|nr:hypothetical protein [Candidatus Chlamydia sanziniae]ANH78318.1 hypothetical protein Cs308_0147 [Candidatus Chlamydia sanziniae]